MIPSPTKPWAMFIYPALSLKSKCFTWIRGGLFTSSYAYSGRYQRWAIDLMELTIWVISDRAQVLFPMLRECLSHHPQLLAMTLQISTELFAEEERST
ncbi:hypothetical protein ACX27_27525 [Nostoc piscinale CENA21]|uniref:Uncharacterized protein n=1 Tax=Nostoc piscinale CENA21 TaxID=224013 RepID=A0A0M5MIB8_9NOSO|nr:hypothetical protein [Nostoc piscinale]ALF55755.1 hypothetical protein ACX27_27525 [Nostoc piscinale CENA21]